MKRVLLGAIAAVLAVQSASAQELRVGVQNMNNYLDPGSDHSNAGSQYYYNSFDTLIDRDHGGSGDFVPGLATEWEIVSPQMIEFTLREGVRFHDGSEMTAEDVVFSLNRMFSPTYPPYLVRKRDRLDNFTRAEATEDGKVRVYTARPEPIFETLLSMQQTMIVPKGYLMGLTGHPEVDEVGDYEAFGLAPVGTGPYRIAEFVPGERIVYERFDDFWGEPAPYERVVATRIPETVSRVTALRSGEVDMITNLAPDQLDLVDGDPNLKTAGSVTPLFHVMIMNVNHPELEDPRIRRALSLAIDRDLLNESLWKGMAEVPSTHTMEEFGELYMPELETFRYDPEEARRLLEEAGYDGATITYDTHSAYYTNGLLAAQAIMEMWDAVGVNGEINVTESWTTCVPEMMTRNWSNPMYFADPFGSFGVMWGPGGPSESCDRFNTDEAYQETWERFRFSETVEERRAAYAELMEFIEQDPPVLPLYRPYEAWGMQADIDWEPLPSHIPYVLDFRAGRITPAAN
ncbi:ABC transporter substrate-binding protein [Billgrantia gudaonensis]|uniref:Peptide/nickel transport system substrate-binding protein n=1 Tax=Billgrantia gudaonensis TaxID=376427 RepID=A0A1G9B5Z6_9GAMM|nr:ABC transporter substrate-binding protein [Halomonas gudaonensis]SDK34966.1 peptide/nickel transport system substrate-binding protein [Halomonas gudaonensis]